VTTGGSRGLGEIEVSCGKGKMMLAVQRRSGGDRDGGRRGGIRDQYVMLCCNRMIVRKRRGRPGRDGFCGWAVEKLRREEHLVGGGVGGDMGVNNRSTIVTIVTIVDHDIVL
jgi:hypothetical protein